MAITIKSRFPLLLLLGVVFLASVCVSFGISQSEQGNPCYEKCLKRYNKMNTALKHHECQSRCEEEEDEDDRSGHRVPGRRERGRQEGEKEEERHEEWRRWHEREEDEDRHGRRERGRQEGEKEEDERHGKLTAWRERDEEEWRGRERRDDPEERARMKYRKERREEREERESESEKRERRKHSEREDEEDEESQSQEQKKNPFLFRSNKFQTLFENENGHIRLLQRFDKRSNLFKNLQNYRLVEYRAKPHTLFLPQHTDADFILLVLKGKALLTVLNSNNRNSYNLECGDTIKLPAGTIAYLANPDNDQDLRVIDLVIPINKPGHFQSFFPAGVQQSYFSGFSRNILEASFNTNYETIEKVLLEEQEDEPQQKKRQQQSQNGDAIVKLSKEQIEELSRHAKSSSKKSKSSKSESEPFNLRNHDPVYSNKFGKFFEITPEKNPQLQDLDIFVSSVEINEGALMLPHYNSRAIVILVINEGKGNLELVGLRYEQQEQTEDEDEQREQEQLQRYRASLSPGDVFVIPAGHPVAVNASSNLNFIGFGINAENNQRNFLAGEDDNVISEIEGTVKEIAFPGSAEEVDRLIKNQRESYFANAQPQQREEGKQRGRVPLSSILGAFY